MKSWKVCLNIVVIVFLFFALCEVFLRVFQVTPPTLYLQSFEFLNPELSKKNVYEEDPLLFWRFQRGIAYEEMSREGPYHNVISADGFRCAPLSTHDKETKPSLFCLGDSVTYGDGVSCDKTYPAVLERTLRQNSDNSPFTVFNGGVPGYSSEQVKRRLIHEIRPLQPDYVLVSCGHNDKYLAVARGDASRIPLSPLVKTIKMTLYSFQSYLFLRNVIFTISEKVTTKSDINNVSANRPRVSISEYEKNLQEMIKACRFMHCELILISEPFYCDMKLYDMAIRLNHLYQERFWSSDRHRTNTREALIVNWRNYQQFLHESLLKQESVLNVYQCLNAMVIEYNQAMKKVAEEESIPFIDTNELFQSSRIPLEDLFLHPDSDPIHPSPGGYEIIATALSRKILSASMEK